MSVATVAASLLELQAHVDVTIDWAAMFVTWLYVGRLPGTLVASVVVERMSSLVALLPSSVLSALFFGLVPYCQRYWTMSAVIGVVGGCSGFISVGR